MKSAYKALSDFTLYQSAMNNDAMTTNFPKKQPLDTDMSAQELPMPNELLNDHQRALDEQTPDMSNDEFDELVADDIVDDEDEDEYEDSEDSVVVAEPAVPVVIDVTHTVIEDEAGLRIDKQATEVFSDFSRVQLEGCITDVSLLYNCTVQKPKIRVKAGDVLHLSTT